MPRRSSRLRGTRQQRQQPTGGESTPQQIENPLPEQQGTPSDGGEPTTPSEGREPANQGGGESERNYVTEAIAAQNQTLLLLQDMGENQREGSQVSTPTLALNQTANPTPSPTSNLTSSQG